MNITVLAAPATVAVVVGRIVVDSVDIAVGISVVIIVANVVGIIFIDGVVVICILEFTISIFSVGSYSQPRDVMSPFLK